MRTVDEHEAKKHFSALLRQIEQHRERVVICRHGIPVAELVPWVKGRDPLQQHPILQQVIIHEDPSLPLTDEEWPSSAR